MMSDAEAELAARDPGLHQMVTRFLAKLDEGWLWVERQTGDGDWVFYNLLTPDELAAHSEGRTLRVHEHPY